MPKPMLTDDYIIRMINQAIEVLIRIVNLKASGDYQQAHQLIEQSLEQLIGLRIDLLQSLDDHNILGTLSMNGMLDVNRVIVVADLFKEEGDVLAAQKMVNSSIRSYQRALYYYLVYENTISPNDDPRLKENIVFLARVLENINCQIETELMLSDYFERMGYYIQGYKILKKLSTNAGFQGEAIVQRIAYLERISEQQLDRKTINDWMSKEEIMQEIAILKGENS
jgi:tetratricopeptide (TPR) repeat protein